MFIYVKSKNIECLPSDNSEDILNQLIDLLLKYFEEKLIICRTDCSYDFKSIEGFSIHFHKIDLRRASSYIPTPYWINVNKAVVNPKSKNDNFCFVYATIIAIYHKEIGKNPDRTSSKLLEHAYKLDWNGIEFTASAPDYKRFEKFNEDIALNIFYVPFLHEDERESDVRPEYISKFNFTRKIPVVLLKISDGDKWHFLALKSEKEDNSDFIRPTKSFSRLMRDISSNSQENYYCFGCFHSFKKHAQLCKDHDFYKIKLPENDKKIKEHKHGSKALRMNDIIYVDLECLLVNYDRRSNNLIKSHTTNVVQHIPSGYSINAVRNHENLLWLLITEEKIVFKICEELRKIGEELFNTKKKPLTPLTAEQEKKHNDSYKCYICQRKFNNNKKK